VWVAVRRIDGLEVRRTVRRIDGLEVRRTVGFADGFYLAERGLCRTAEFIGELGERLGSCMVRGCVMNKWFKIAGGGLLALVGSYVVAGRSLGELAGYFRASADGTVAQLEEQLPQEVHDRKLAHDLTTVRKEVIERQVKLSQSKTQIAQLRDDVQKLEASLAVRKRLLAEAYPILEAATRDNVTQVRFANADYPLADFQREVDDLLAMQDSETKQLDIKQSGLARLERSEREGELALTEMRRALDSAEQEVAVLKSRREQAETESQTLDMVASVASASAVTSDNVGKCLNRLRTDVSRLESENDAKRDMAPVAGRQSTNQLARQWNRLEELKKYQAE
jgi:hypothetical protein